MRLLTGREPPLICEEQAQVTAERSWQGLTREA